MAWDDDKSTATDPDNPSANEQLTADEWDNHVGDQLSRLEYGPLSSRPAASERDQGALWFDEYGRISRVDSNGNWVLDSFGTSSNPVPNTSHFEAISTDELNNETVLAPDDNLKNAIETANVGETIYVSPGEYQQPSSRIIADVSDVTVEFSPGAWLRPPASGEHVIEVIADNFVMDGWKFDGTDRDGGTGRVGVRVSQNPEGFRLKNFRVKDWPTPFANLRKTTDFEIRDGIMLDVYEGIPIFEAKSGTISGVRSRSGSSAGTDAFIDLKGNNSVVEDITISDCVAENHDTLIGFGTETNAGIRNISISDCVGKEIARGFWFKPGSGGDVEGVTISNCTLKDLTGANLRQSLVVTDGGNGETVRDLEVKNLVIRATHPAVGSAARSTVQVAGTLEDSSIDYRYKAAGTGDPPSRHLYIEGTARDCQFSPKCAGANDDHAMLLSGTYKNLTIHDFQLLDIDGNSDWLKMNGTQEGGALHLNQGRIRGTTTTTEQTTDKVHIDAA